jgi:tRNA-dihydrouridine synthase A
LVEEIKKNHPNLIIELNGGLHNVQQVKDALEKFDGVMIGREAYQRPYFLAELEKLLSDNINILSPETVARHMIAYIEKQQKLHNTQPKSITRHMMGLFKGCPGGAKWRRSLSEADYRNNSIREIISDALLETKECDRLTNTG